MSFTEPNDRKLLKKILEPLLEDFQYWFARSRSLLENERIHFLSEAEQTDLLDRVKSAQQEVQTTKMMFKVMEGQVGVTLTTLTPWHRLVTISRQIAYRWHLTQKNSD